MGWKIGIGLAVGLHASAASPNFIQRCQSELLLTAVECASVSKLHLSRRNMRPPSQPEAESERAAALGFTLFFDPRLSRNGAGVACVRCHLPEHAFSERRPRSQGIAEVTRNAPSLFNAAYKSKLFWDGRASSLREQPLITMETPEEMDLTRLELAHQMALLYREPYARIFGSFPDLSDSKRFPPRGKPGDAAYAAMRPEDRAVVDQIAQNVGVLFEAYVRKLAAREAPLDQYIDGDSETLSPAAKRGLRAFVKKGCISCHSGALLSDEKLHDLRVPLVKGTPTDTSTVITPPLRNLVLTAPYGHNGTFATLPEVLAHHSKVLEKRSPSAEETESLIAFLRHLTGQRPGIPWSNWPAR